MNEDIFGTNEEIIGAALEAARVAVMCMRFAKEVKLHFGKQTTLPDVELIDMALEIYGGGLEASNVFPDLYDDMCDLVVETLESATGDEAE